MGAFWIFVSILTFVYIIYYVIIVGMDLFGGKDKKKSDVEVIAISKDEEPPSVEEPVKIREEGDIDQSHEDQGEDMSATKDHTEDIKPSTPEEILSEDSDELHKALTEAQENMSNIISEAQDEISAEEYDNNRLEMLMAAGEEAVKNF